MTRVLAIARNTFREAVRNKILYSLLLFAVALILASLALGEFTLGEGLRLTRDLGLYGIDMFSVLIAIFLGVNMLYKELQLKTVYTILPKPIARYQFVLGKWLGLVFTLALQVAAMGVVLQVALFTQGAGFEPAVMKAEWLLFVNVVVVTSIALAFSAFSTPFLSGVFSLGIFVVGRAIPDFLEMGHKAGGFAGTAVDWAGKVLPNLHLFFPSGAVVGAAHVSVHGELVNLDYVLSTTLYGLGYSALVVALAVAIFRKRDFV
ncbi:MAG: hypothetical protein SF187_00300 [Deltaproteobacteria bacterium]|nr:hypothetical protein [Deltaproteobacteria bacterium]